LECVRNKTADLGDYADFPNPLVHVGWENRKRIHGCIIHVDIIDSKVWIQYDGTEDGIALELEEAGIPKDKIVLGFKTPDIRKYTGYAVS